MIIRVLQAIFNTRPNELEIDVARREIKRQSKATVKSLQRVDRVLQENRDITHNIAIAMGLLKYAK